MCACVRACVYVCLSVCVCVWGGGGHDYREQTGAETQRQNVSMCHRLLQFESLTNFLGKQRVWDMDKQEHTEIGSWINGNTRRVGHGETGTHREWDMEKQEHTESGTWRNRNTQRLGHGETGTHRDWDMEKQEHGETGTLINGNMWRLGHEGYTRIVSGCPRYVTSGDTERLGHVHP